MRKLAILAAIAAIALTAVPAQAEMTYSPFLFDAFDASGSPIVDGTYMMIMDLNDNGWQGFSYLSQGAGSADNALSWLWDSGDYLMGRGQITNGEAFPVVKFNASDVPGYSIGAKYYMLWFDKPYSEADAGPGMDINYGVSNIDGLTGNVLQAISDPGDDGPWIFGSAANLTTTTVPEPIAGVLMLIGAGMLGMRRRFDKVSA